MVPSFNTAESSRPRLRFAQMADLQDGAYDVVVVDVVAVDDTSMRLDVVVTSGEQKGFVISLRGPARVDDGIALLGEPGRLVVTDGAPSLKLG